MQKTMLGRSLRNPWSWLLGVSVFSGAVISQASERTSAFRESDVRAIITDLRSSDREAVSRSSERLRLFGPGESEFALLLGAELKQECSDARHYGGIDSLVAALGNMGKGGKSAVGVLLECSVQAHSPLAYVKALDRIATTLDTIPPDVIDAINGKDFHMRSRGIDFLSSMGPTAKAAVPLILKILNDPHLSVIPDYDLRGGAIMALGSIGPAAKDGVPTMVKLFADTSTNRRITAIAIGNIGPGAKEAVPALMKALNDDDQDLRIFSARALLRIGTPDALKAVKAYTQKGGKT